MRHAALMAVTAGLVAIAAPAEAQLVYVGVRGGAGIPTGVFADADMTPDTQVWRGAKAGFGYGLDAGVNLGPVGLYAGFDRIRFGCSDEACAGPGGNFKLQGVSAGVRLAIPLIPIIKPWIKGGVTFAELDSDFGQAASRPRFTSERTPGYELGAGFDIPFAGGFFSVTPQVRYVGQKFDYRVPGVTTGDTSSADANYYTFDIGLRIRSPI